MLDNDRYKYLKIQISINGIDIDYEFEKIMKHLM